PRSARTTQATFKDPAPAPATVLTVLPRLEGKGLVTRHASSPRRVTFEATMSSAQPHASNMVELLDGAEDREGALLAFADSLSEEDLDLVMDAITSRRERLTPGNGIPDSVAVALSQRRRRDARSGHRGGPSALHLHGETDRMRGRGRGQRHGGCAVPSGAQRQLGPSEQSCRSRAGGQRHLDRRADGCGRALVSRASLRVL